MTKKRGRPPTPVPVSITDEIIDWISMGKTLREFCRQPGKPSWSAVYDWLEKDDGFAQRFARARDMGHDAIAEETLELIDAEPRIITCDGAARYDSAHVAWTKNRVEQRMKLLAKWNPRKYGDKIDLTSGGKSGLLITIDMGEK